MHLQIGNEFSSVEALWSQFETVMGQGVNADDGAAAADVGTAGQGTETGGNNGYGPQR